MSDAAGDDFNFAETGAVIIGFRFTVKKCAITRWLIGSEIGLADSDIGPSSSLSQ